MLARYGSERQFGNTFRRMANTSFSKIQFVAKVFQEVPSLGLAPLPHHRSTRRHRLWPAKWILTLLYWSKYQARNIQQKSRFQYKKQFSPPGTAGIQRSDRSCCSQPDKKKELSYWSYWYWSQVMLPNRRQKSMKTRITSVNSISSMPSPVYQWRKALRRNMAVNCSEILLNSSCWWE